MRLAESLKNDIIARLLPLQPEKIILFGSYAYGEPHKDSDIDLLVVTNDDFMPHSFQEKVRIRLQVSRAILDIRMHYPTDLIVHTKPMHQKFIELDSLFAREILKKGVVLYEGPDQSLA